jgi:hypothetical protein
MSNTTDSRRYVIMRTHTDGYVDYFAGNGNYIEHRHAAERGGFTYTRVTCQILNDYSDTFKYYAVELEA